MKISYKISNLRKIKETPFIDVRPLTILVGKNSAGKSTFLRSFPLLRQSIETKASAPILWWGDYVDFGNFKSSVRNKDTNTAIAFSFRAEEFSAPVSADNRFLSRAQRPRRISEKVEWVELTHEISGNDNSTHRRSITIRTSNSRSFMRIEFSEGAVFGSIKIGNSEMKEFLPDADVYIPPEGLFEEPFFLRRVKEGKSRRLVGWPRSQMLHDRLRSILQKHVAKTVSETTIGYEARKLLSITELDDAALDEVSEGSIKAVKKFYSFLKGNHDSGIGLEIKSICRLAHFCEVLDALSSSLKTYYSDVEYIGPARARSERFYRQQELQVADISPDGRNLPMFLASLDEREQSELSEWVEDRFGYGVKLDRVGSHISINLMQDGEEINVIDTGYGVSQVLPVLAQIWWMGHQARYMRRGPRSMNSTPILTIEQPELHLHPAHQALLAEVFADVVRRSPDLDNPISLIVETHSEALINKIGELIYDGKIDSDAVQIVVFGEGDGDENVSLSTYGSDGVLMNWPHGFFIY